MLRPGLKAGVHIPSSYHLPVEGCTMPLCGYPMWPYRLLQHLKACASRNKGICLLVNLSRTQIVEKWSDLLFGIPITILSTAARASGLSAEHVQGHGDPTFIMQTPAAETRFEGMLCCNYRGITG